MKQKQIFKTSFYGSLIIKIVIILKSFNPKVIIKGNNKGNIVWPKNVFKFKTKKKNYELII